MIRVLLLDLGGTLTDGQHLFPHVSEALSTLSQFVILKEKPLELGLVSDFKAPADPTSSNEIDTIFREYVGILHQLHLDHFFHPVEKHVTLSTQAGVRKPDRRIFELALRRLKSTAGLNECIFITEESAHITACKALGMHTLQFGTDFKDWADCPSLVAHLISPKHHANLEAALRTRLAAVEGIELESVEHGANQADLKAHARAWVPVHGKDLGELDGVHVKHSVDLHIQRDAKGLVHTVTRDVPTHEETNEAAYMVRSLMANQQVQTTDGPLGPGVTHIVKTDPRGRRVLERKRYSAV
jgi:FMN phosphatase YigB (HAD superfamily)